MEPMDKLIDSAKLTGRIDLLMELREWLNAKIAAAESDNERLRASPTFTEIGGEPDEH